MARAKKAAADAPAVDRVDASQVPPDQLIALDNLGYQLDRAPQLRQNEIDGLKAEAIEAYVNNDRRREDSARRVWTFQRTQASNQWFLEIAITLGGLELAKGLVALNRIAGKEGEDQLGDLVAGLDGQASDRTAFFAAVQTQRQAEKRETFQSQHPGVEPPMDRPSEPKWPGAYSQADALRMQAEPLPPQYEDIQNPTPDAPPEPEVPQPGLSDPPVSEEDALAAAGNDTLDGGEGAAGRAVQTPIGADGTVPAGGDVADTLPGGAVNSDSLDRSTGAGDNPSSIMGGQGLEPIRYGDGAPE